MRLFRMEILSVLAFLGLAGLAVFRAQDAALEQVPVFEHSELAVDESESWQGIYAQGSKIGYSVHRRGRTAEGGVLLRERTLLRMAAFGQEREIRLRVDAELDSLGVLKSFRAWMSTDPVSISAQGQQTATGLRVQVESGGAVIKTMDFGQEVTIPVNLYPSIAQQSPKAGSSFTVPVFDPITLTQNESTVDVLGYEDVPETQGVKGYHLRTKVLGAEGHSWIDGLGNVLREEGILGMVTLAETRDEALHKGWSKDGQAPDLIALSAVPTTGRSLPSDRPSSSLRLRITGPKVVERLLLDQYPKHWKDGVLSLEQSDLGQTQSYALPAAERFDAYLRAETLVEVDDPAIQNAAIQASLGEGDARIVAEKLSQWVHDRLEKTPVFGVPGARSTLDSGKGDCNEHTALYTAMARSLGLPTRVAAGLVWSNGLSRHGAFYYHAWPEVWLGQWVAVDPTFGEFPADASHIRLVVGDLSAQTEMVGVIGNLEIEVLEAQ